MKVYKFFFPLLIGLWSCISAVQSQSLSLIIKKTDNTEQKIDLTLLKKITFSTTNLIVNYVSGTNENVPFVNIQKMIFSTAVSEINNPGSVNKRLEVYPNPATEYIAFRNQFEGNLNCSVYSVSGMLVLNQALSGSSSRIDISSLKQGVYFIKVNNQFSKFIKQ